MPGEDGPDSAAARPAAAVGEPVQASAVGVVVPYGEGGAGRGGDGGHHGGDHDRRLRGGLAPARGVEAEGDEEEGAVEEEDEQAEDEGGDQKEEPDEEGPGEGGEQAEDTGAAWRR